MGINIFSYCWILFDSEKILFYSSAIIGLFIGFGYIFQGIILSFLVYYITINQSDLFSILVEDEEDQEDDSANNKIMWGNFGYRLKYTRRKK